MRRRTAGTPPYPLDAPLMRQLRDRPVGRVGRLRHAHAHLVNRTAGLLRNAGAGAQLASRSLQLSGRVGQLLRERRQRVSRRRQP